MSHPSQFSLLTQNRFGPFFWTQFLGAFNDNVFKTALLTIITYDALSWSTIDAGLLNNLIPGLFILPFVLFSALAGQLADKFDKARMSRAIKLLEIAIMLVAAVGSNYALFFDHLQYSAGDGTGDGPDADTLASLLMANVTTVVSFGLLATASVPALAAVGLAVAPGALLALALSAAFMPARVRIARPDAPSRFR